MKIIKNATLTKISKIGDQLYTWKKPHPTIGTSIWLCGWNRNQNAKIGDKGQLEYIVSSSYGLWFFKLDKIKRKEE